MKTLSCPVALILLLIAALPLGAQQHRRYVQPRVIVFQDANFQGDALVLYPGDAIENLAKVKFENGGKTNDKISSILVEGGASLSVYENSGFKGKTLVVTESISNLSFRPTLDGSWNDRISSIVVEGTKDRRDDRRSKEPDMRESAETIVTRAYRELLGRDPDRDGLALCIRRINNDGWSEDQVRDSIRRSVEFARYAETLIGKAYREVLNRDPDESGMRSYRRLMIEERWTDGMVKEHLRQSDEYRKRPKKK